MSEPSKKDREAINKGLSDQKTMQQLHDTGKSSQDRRLKAQALKKKQAEDAQKAKDSGKSTCKLLHMSI